MFTRLLKSTLACIVLAACAVPGEASPTPPGTATAEAPLITIDLFSDGPCQAPCWMNMTPGETTYAEARKIFDDPASGLICEDLSGDQTAIGCNDVGLDFDPMGTLTRMWFFPPSDLHLSEIIDHFGEPDALYFEYGSIPESPTEIITVEFAARGAWVKFEYPHVDYSVTADMVAESIVLLPAGSDDYFTPGYIVTMGVSEVSWQGYRDYKSIVPEN